MMTDPAKEEASATFALPELTNPGFVGQLRQLSVPLLARLAAFVLAVLTLFAGIFLVWQGWDACAPDKCKDLWLESGVKVIGTSFLPAVILVYLVFAETGVKALVRKSTELLRKTVPQALALESSDEYLNVMDELACCAVETIHADGSPRACYRLKAQRNDEQAQLDVMLDLNVSKINVVFLIPVDRQARADSSALLGRFRATLDGAAHEGYVIDKTVTETVIDGRPCAKLVARLRMNDNFLWDPARKLHFAQDLRMFCHAMLVEGWDVLRRP